MEGLSLEAKEEEDDDDDQDDMDIKIDYIESKGKDESTPYFSSKVLEERIAFGSLHAYKRLTSESAPFISYHLEIDPGDNEATYQPGDYMRQYSISSSPLVTKQIHITFVLLDKTKERTSHKDPVYGQCTLWMHKMIQKFEETRDGDLSIPIAFKIDHSLHFKLPADLATPLILVSTGTGLAPYRSFLHHRRHLIQQLDKSSAQHVGKCLLFFGCRRKDWDLLYHQELLDLEKDGTITHLFLAFSQDPAHGPFSVSKKYINSHIEENVYVGLKALPILITAIRRGCQGSSQVSAKGICFNCGATPHGYSGG
eukprot:gene13686-16123_t